MKNIQLSILIIAVLLICVGCSLLGSDDSSEITDTILKSDIEKLDDPERWGLYVNNMTVISSTENKSSDEITYIIKCDAQNIDLVYSGQIKLVYTKVKDEWVLSDHENERLSFDARDEGDELAAETYIKNQYISDFQESGVDYSNVQYTFEVVSEEGCCEEYYHVSNSFKYVVTVRENSVCTYQDNWDIHCYCDKTTGWTVDEARMTEHMNETWDLCGTYVLKNDYMDVTVIISQFSIDTETSNVTISYSWDFTAQIDFPYSTAEPGVTYSDGPLGGTHYFNIGNQYCKFSGDIASIYFCGRNAPWNDVIGNNPEEAGVFIDIPGDASYWLTKISS